MDSWFFYMAIYIPSLGYVLRNCFFCEKDLSRVQQSALHAFLAKTGYNWNTRCRIVFAPIRYGGCGFTVLYTLQGEGQILAFLKHWRTNSDAGRLLCISVAWTQLHLGVSFGFLADTATPLPHMPGQWLKSLRMFLARLKGSLELDELYLPPIQEENDTYIMDAILHSGCFSATEISQINHCQMYLQAITISDLCLDDGVSLDNDMLDGNPGWCQQ
jgi:hypothetical protein